MSAAAGEGEPNGANALLVVLSGPSGVGKDSVIAELKKLDRPWRFVVTATTRPPRPGEEDGVDYIFLEEGEFTKLQESGMFLESATYSGRWYGTPRAQVSEALAEGNDVFLKIDVQGAESVRKVVDGGLFIFLAPASVAELAARLAQRNTENPAETERRLQIAREELEQADSFDYRVVNRDGNLRQAVEDIVTILELEKRRVGRRPPILD